MKTSKILLSCVAACVFAGQAMALSTMQGRYVGGGPALVGVTTPGVGITSAGALGHRFWSASDAGTDRFTDGATTFNNASIVYTFCIDNRFVQNVNQTYTLRQVTEAPVSTNGNPAGGTTYSADNARRLNAIMLAARDLGYVDHRGFFKVGDITSIVGGLSESQLGAAIQLLCWESVWDETPVGHSAASDVWNLAVAQGGSPFTATGGNVAGLTLAVNQIRDAAYAIFTNPNTKILVRAITTTAGSDQGQDQVVIIPLPAAAWAGMGMMAGVFGLAHIRRRKNAMMN